MIGHFGNAVLKGKGTNISGRIKLTRLQNSLASLFNIHEQVVAVFCIRLGNTVGADHVVLIGIQIGQIVNILCLRTLAINTLIGRILAASVQSSYLNSRGSTGAGVEASIAPGNGATFVLVIIISAILLANCVGIRMQISNQTDVVVAGDIQIEFGNRVFANLLGRCQHLEVLSDIAVLVGIVLSLATPNLKVDPNVTSVRIGDNPAGSAGHSVEAVRIQATKAVVHIDLFATQIVGQHTQALVLGAIVAQCNIGFVVYNIVSNRFALCRQITVAFFVYEASANLVTGTFAVKDIQVIVPVLIQLRGDIATLKLGRAVQVRQVPYIGTGL